MKKLIAAIALIASAGAAYAQMPTPEQILKDNDKNNDGVITKEEAKGSMMEQFFDFMDGNHDGKITADELKAMSGPPGGAPGGAPPAQ